MLMLSLKKKGGGERLHTVTAWFQIQDILESYSSKGKATAEDEKAKL